MSAPRIIICRHAESLEDVDNSIYDTIKDLDIPLTDKGVRQACDFGETLQKLLKDTSHAMFYTSPGIRNVQTLQIVLPKLSASIRTHVEVEPLIVKQDWGYINAENRPGIEAERYKVGVLRYTFPTGESATSLIRRLTTFRDKIFHIQRETNCDIVILSHGFEFRVFLMIVLGWEEEFFESFGNLDNCEHRILTRQDDGRYALDRPLKQHGLPITRLKK